MYRIFAILCSEAMVWTKPLYQFLKKKKKLSMIMLNISWMLHEGPSAHHVTGVLNSTNFSHRGHVWSCWLEAVSIPKLCGDELQSFHHLWVLAKKEKPARVVELYNLCLNDNKHNSSCYISWAAQTFWGSLHLLYLDVCFFNGFIHRQIIHKDLLLSGSVTRLPEAKLKDTTWARWQIMNTSFY